MTTKKIGTPDEMLGRDEDMDQTQKNKEFVIRHFESLNQRDVETVKANMSPALFDHELEGDHQHDVEEGGKCLRELMKRIPNLKVELRDVIADRDKVIVRAVWSGRDVQSGSAMEFHGFVEWRIADGKFVERWATVTPLAEVKSQLETCE
jgi:ketosteroid isomerase-like protein